jgi:hypothetical protein
MAKRIGPYLKYRHKLRSEDMKHFLRALLLFSALILFSAQGLFSADAKAGSLTCVGLYSETSDGYVSYRATAGKGDWIAVKVGDVVPATGEISIVVDRDWVEFTPTGNPNTVYEIAGPDSGKLVKSVSEILKLKAKTVSFPKGSADKPDPKFKNKLSVKQYLGRQIYITKDGDSNDIKYGDILDATGKIKIIAINNTINLMNASGQVTSVIGPLNFTVDQVLNNKNLYKFLNVQK